MAHRSHGIDEHQRLARIAVGMEASRQPRPKEKRVDGVIPVRCPRCECTGARPIRAKEFICSFCGATGQGEIL